MNNFIKIEDILEYSDFIKIGYVLLLTLIDCVFYMCSTVNFFGERIYKSKEHKERYIFISNIYHFAIFICIVPIMIKMFIFSRPV